MPIFGMSARNVRLEVLYRDLAEARELLALDDEGRPTQPVTPIDAIARDDDPAPDAAPDESA